MTKPGGIATVVAIVVGALSTLQSQAAGNEFLASDGLGRVKFGMSLSQVEAALGASLKGFPNSHGSYETCETAKRKDGRDAGLSFMFEARRLTRIDVSSPDSTRLRPAISTQMGVGIGSTESAVEQAYGAALRVEPHTDFNLLEVFDKGNRRGVIFETDGKQVTSFRAGVEPAIEYSEGCE